MIKRNIIAFAMFLALIVGYVLPASAHEKGKPYQVIFQINEADPKKMNMVLNNVKNVIKHFESQDREYQIEVTAYGPGLTMLRDDKSPVKGRVSQFTEIYPNVSFAACGNTLKKMTKKEGKKPPLMKSDKITVVGSGVINILERQDQGWHYVRP